MKLKREERQLLLEKITRRKFKNITAAAEKIGTAHSTVYKALNGREIKLPTYMKIKAFCRREEYRPVEIDIEKLRATFAEKNITLAELATKTGLALNTLEKLIFHERHKGLTGNCCIDRIADALGCQAEDLVKQKTLS